MKVFVAGASGVLGRRLVAQLTTRGTEVAGLTTTPAGEALIRSLGGQAHRVNLFDSGALARAMEGSDVVIHAATRIPVGIGARFRRAWRENDRVRRDGTRSLATAAAEAGVRHFLQQSVAWVVRSHGGPFDEGVRPDPPELVRSSVEGEAIARGIGARRGMRVGVLRGGAFYGPEASRDLVTLIRKGRMPIPGEGDALKAPIHVEDMARAFVMVADAGAEGVWNVVDDEPVALARLLRYLADAFGAPAPRRIPLWCARALFGQGVLESLTAPMDTTNSRIRREVGWAPSFPTYREGIAQMASGKG